MQTEVEHVDAELEIKGVNVAPVYIFDLSVLVAGRAYFGHCVESFLEPAV